MFRVGFSQLLQLAQFRGWSQKLVHRFGTDTVHGLAVSQLLECLSLIKQQVYIDGTICVNPLFFFQRINLISRENIIKKYQACPVELHEFWAAQGTTTLQFQSLDLQVSSRNLRTHHRDLEGTLLGHLISTWASSPHCDATLLYTTSVLFINKHYHWWFSCSGCAEWTWFLGRSFFEIKAGCARHGTHVLGWLGFWYKFFTISIGIYTTNIYVYSHISLLSYCYKAKSL